MMVAVPVVLATAAWLVGFGGSAPVWAKGQPLSLARFQGRGFSLSVPRHWVAAVSTQGGRTARVWVPRGAQTAKLTVTYGTVRQMNGSAAQLAAQYPADNAALAPSDRAKVSSAPAHVAGARHAVLLTLSGHSKVGVHDGRLLFVQTSGGIVIEVDAARFAGHSTFDPAAIVRSFKLTRGGSG